MSKLDVARYSRIEKMRNGCRLEIRAQCPDDRAALLDAVDRASAQSLYRRFFGVKHHFSEKEIDFFLNVDFNKHVALVAVVDEQAKPTIAGGGRYVVVGAGTAELAFVVVDQYQGHSIGTALMRHLTAIAKDAGLTELVADVLPDNAPMLKVFERSGLPVTRRRETGSVHITLGLQ
jgi:RimJ/RimL family protein N-acetyltransferase